MSREELKIAKMIQRQKLFIMEGSSLIFFGLKIQIKKSIENNWLTCWQHPALRPLHRPEKQKVNF